MADIIRPYLNKDHILDRSNKANKPKKSRRGALMLGAAGLLASIGYLSIDGPEKGITVTNEVKDINSQNEKYIKTVREFVKLLNDYKSNNENKQEAYTKILDSYFNLVNLFGQTYEFDNSYPIKVEKVIPSHQHQYDFHARQVPNQFKEDLRTIDKEITLSFNATFFPKEDSQETQTINILTSEQMQDPWVAFSELDASFKPSVVNLKDYRIILTKMSTLLGIMLKKSESESGLKVKYNKANSQFVIYKNHFLKQLEDLNKK